MESIRSEVSFVPPPAAGEAVAWSDRWLGCSSDGHDFHRRWVVLSDTDLYVLYDAASPLSGALLTMSLKELQFDTNERRFQIAIYNQSDDVIFKCGEALEFRATLDALTRRIAVAQSVCALCPELQRSVEDLVGQLQSQRRAAEVAQEECAKLSGAQQAAQHQRAEADRLRGQLHEASAKAEAESAKAALLESRRITAEERATAAEKDARAANEQLRAAVAEVGAASRAADASAAEKKGLADALSAAEASLLKTRDANAELRKNVAQHEAADVDARDRLTAALQEGERARSAAADEVRAFRAQVELLTVTATQRADNEARLAAQLRAAQDAERRAADAAETLTRDRELEAQQRSATEARRRAETSRADKAEADLAAVQRALQQTHAETLASRAALQRRVEEHEAAAASLREQLASERAQAVDAAQKHRAVAREYADALQAVQAQHDRVAADAAAAGQELAQQRSQCASTAATLAECRGALDELLAYKARAESVKRSDAAVGPERGAEALGVAHAATATQGFVEAVSRSPEFETALRLHAAGAVAELVRSIADIAGSAQLSVEAAAELTPILGAMRAAVTAAAAETCGPTLASGGPGVSTSGRAASRLTAQQLGATLDSLAIAEAKAAAGVVHLDHPQSSLGRACTVASAAGFIECLKTFDATSGFVSSNHQFREAVMTFLKGPASHARAVAHEVTRGGAGLRNQALDAACRKLNADYCEMFDFVLRCAGSRALADAAWRRGVSRATSECAALAAALAAEQRAKRPADAALEETRRKVERLATTVKQLIGADGAGQRHAPAVRDLVVGHARLQAAFFCAIRQANRALVHHSGAESIARFGVALKRAGQILEQSKIPGSAPHAAECLAGWPIAKLLAELPRRLVEEDRAFAVMWDAVLATQVGTLVIPATETEVA